MRGPSLACLAIPLLLSAAFPAAAGASVPASVAPSPRPTPTPTPTPIATDSTDSPDFDLLLPSFDYTATFLTPEADGALRAEETGHIRVDLTNLDERKMTGIRVTYKALTPVPGLSQEGSVPVPDLAAGATTSVDIAMASTRALPTLTAEYVLEIHAAGGYYGSPARLSFQTLAFVPPKLDLVGVDIRRPGRARSVLPLTRVPIGHKVLLVAQIENQGLGPAQDVSARFGSSDPAVTLSSTGSIRLGVLERDQTRDVAIGVRVAPSYSGAPELPVWIQVDEKHSDLGFRELLPLPLEELPTASVPASPRGRGTGPASASAVLNGHLTKSGIGLTKPGPASGT